MSGRISGVARFIASLGAAALVAAALSGCAPTVPEISADAASRMQASVVAVTQAAAVGDPAGAITALDALEEQLKQDTASGAISAERAAEIQASIDLVRADLTAALPAPAPEPEPAPAPSQEEKDNKDNKGKNGEDNGNKKDKDD